MSSLSVYEIRWVTGDMTADLVGFSDEKRDVIASKKLDSGETMLVLFKPGSTWYAGSMSGSRYSPAKYEIYIITKRTPRPNVYEASKELDFPTRRPKKDK